MIVVPGIATAGRRALVKDEKAIYTAYPQLFPRVVVLTPATGLRMLA
jgi:hypothetical protein